MNDNEEANGFMNMTLTSSMEICPNQKPTSGMEDSSASTDATKSISAPIEILVDFLASIMVKDYQSAFKYCELILRLEPNYNTAKEFFPLLSEECSQRTMKEDDDDSLSDSDSDSDNTIDDSDDDDGSDDDSGDDNEYEDNETAGSISSPGEDTRCDVDVGVGTTAMIQTLEP